MTAQVEHAGPVVFDPFSDDFFNHPYETYRRMRDEAPVYYNAQYDFWALTRHADVSAAMKDFQTYTSTKGIDLASVQSGMEMPPQLLMTDPPDHRRMRGLINKVFTPRAIDALEPMIREQIQVYLDGCDPTSFDAVEDFSALFPVEIITRMLGVPEEHRQNLRLWLDDILAREYGVVEFPQKGMEAAVKTWGVYWELLQERRARPQDDMISRLIEVELEREDGSKTRLDDIEISSFATLLGGAGAETVTKLIGNAMVTFWRFPEQWQKLLDDRSKIPLAVEELLRYEAPAQYLVRSNTVDVTLHGVTIPAGSPVMLIVGAANRDERAFPDPDVFDIERDRTVAQNLGLGYGIHSCLGAALARMESKIALAMLLDFVPRYEVVEEGLTRVAMTNVAGWHNVPVRVPA